MGKIISVFLLTMKTENESIFNIPICVLKMILRNLDSLKCFFIYLIQHGA